MGSFTVHRGDQRLELTDFSTNGLGLILPEAEYCARVGDQIELELRCTGTPLARLSIEIAGERGAVPGSVGARVDRLTPVEVPAGPAAAAVSLLADEGLARTLVARLAMSHSEGHLVTQDGLHAPVVLSSTPGSETLSIIPGPGSEDVLEKARDMEVVVHVVYGGASFRLSSRLERCEQGFALSAPIQVTSVSRRRVERFPLQPGRASLEWQHPLNPSQWLCAEVLDFSPSGVSILTPSEPTWLPPAPGSATWLRVDDLELPIYVELRRAEAAGPNGGRLGLSFSTTDESAHVLITRAYQRARWPGVGLRSEVASASVEELMQASGYAALREGTEPVSGWHSPPGDERVTVDLVYRSEQGDLVGHFSGLRTYPETWIYHQLATLPSDRYKAAYALYVLLIEWTLSLARERAFAIAYFNQEKRWHQTLFADFVRFVGSDALSVIVSLDRLERAATSPEPRSDPRARVRPAAAGDHSFVTSLARSMLPRLTADALHLHEHSTATPTLCPEHAAVGLERARAALVVEVDGLVLGAALCETGSRKLSLFNILNMAQVYVSPDGSREQRRLAETALLSSVLAFYERRGVNMPLIAAPSGTLTAPESAGLRVVEKMGLWAASKEGLQHWRNHVHLELGSRAARSERAHDKTHLTYQIQGSTHEQQQ